VPESHLPRRKGGERGKGDLVPLKKRGGEKYSSEWLASLTERKRGGGGKGVGCPSQLGRREGGGNDGRLLITPIAFSARRRKKARKSVLSVVVTKKGESIPQGGPQLPFRYKKGEGGGRSTG